MMGISNLTTGSTGKNRSVKKIDSYYLSMAYSLGLDYALINVFNKNLKNLISFIKILEENLIFSPAIFQE
jgi:cobalamin-dependent methionine synthase I